MSPSPTLNGLPQHILQQIAASTDEPTIWATMAVSRSLREAGEKALKPFLAEKVVTAKPSFLMNELQSIPLMSDEAKVKTRLDILRGRTELFSKHLDAYPNSLTHLKHLTLEVISQEYDYKASNSLLQKLLPQLERLEVHIMEPPLAPIELARGEDDDSEGSEDGWDMLREEVRSDQLNDVLSTISALWDGATGEEDLHSLTTLSIHTTCRVLEHLDALCRFVPNVRRLTLGAHWSESEILSGWLRLGDLMCLPRESAISKLEELVVIGGLQTILNALAILIRPPHAIRSVTLHILALPPPETAFHAPTIYTEISTPKAERHRVENLALYGPTAFVFFRTKLYSQGPFNLDATFQHISVLVLERHMENGKRPSLYPLLNSNSANQPDLPSIQRISFIDRHTDASGAYTLGTLDPTGSTDFSSSKARRALFDRYPTLQQILFIAGYPIDPFGEPERSTWEEHNIRFAVGRRDDKLKVWRSSLVRSKAEAE